jgi:hypothetical protein
VPRHQTRGIITVTRTFLAALLALALGLMDSTYASSLAILRRILRLEGALE